MKMLSQHFNKLLAAIKQFLAPIIGAGTRGLPADLTRKVRTVNSLAFFTAILAAPIGTWFYFSTDHAEIMVPALAEATLFCLVILLNHFRQYNAAALGVLLTHCMGAIYFSALLGPIINISLMVIFMFGICFLVYSTLKMQIIGAAATLLTLFLVEANLYAGIIEPLNLSIQDQFLLRWVSLASFMLFDVVVVLFYVAENKRLNNRLTLYVSEVSHELRNNLTSTSFIVRQIYVKVKAKESLAELVNAVETLKIQQDGMLAIANNVLKIDEIESGKQETIDKNPVKTAVFFKHLIEPHRLRAKSKNMALRPLVAADLPEHILIDSFKVSAIISNLLSNAVKYGNHNSSVIVEVKKDKGKLKVAVSNEAPELTPTALSRLFDRHYRVKGSAKVEGSGIGLYIVKSLVARINGAIAANYSNGRIIFDITIPLEEAFGAALPADNEDLQVADFIGKHLMVVDDNSMIRDAVKICLKGTGCTITMASDGSEVIGLLDKMTSLPDLILLDQNMTNMKGTDVLPELRAHPRYKGLTIVMWTGSISDTAGLLAAGADQVLQKPADPGTIHSLLRDI